MFLHCGFCGVDGGQGSPLFCLSLPSYLRVTYHHLFVFRFLDSVEAICARPAPAALPVEKSFHPHPLSPVAEGGPSKNPSAYHIQIGNKESWNSAIESIGTGRCDDFFASIERKWICSHSLELKLERQSGKHTKKRPRHPVSNTPNCRILNFIIIGFWNVTTNISLLH